MSTPRRARRQASRSSSFLGAIKTIVTAPLSWFSAEAPQNGAKRKQQAAPSPYDVIHSEDDEDQSSDYGSSRVKRMRLDSPPASQPYLDPPASAFTHSLPTLPSRNPPRRNLSRDVSMANPEEAVPLPITRDRSMPALTSKTSSFRMRTSLTPQPSGPNFGPTVRRPERDASEPPPLTSLMTNPIFVRAPSEQFAPSHPSTTLGSLADSRRISRSHSRGSILFGSQPPPNSAPVRVTNAAEQALHELEIYKTPLLPTRLRGSSGIPEMFKQRKHPPIVLTREREGKGRLGKTPKSKKAKEEVTNESKPYAGAGGMKKLLAKIREEETTEKTSPVKDVHKSPERPRSPPKEAPTADIPPLTEPFRVEPRPSTQSSLRVGRSKQSRHAQSVARPSKSRFSAVYEDDDNMDEDVGAREQERKMLEEAAKKAPAFNIPANFSFAKDVPPPSQPAPSSEAKEPPLTSLPFSFTKRSVPSPERSAAPSPPSVVVSEPTPAPSPAPPVPAFSFNTPPVSEPKAKEAMMEEPPKSASSVPNFFAKSSAILPSALTVPAGNMFGLSSAPVVDTSSPFWGEKPKEAEKELAPPVPVPAPAPAFGGFGAPTPTSVFGAAPAPSSLFGAPPVKEVPVENKEAEAPKPLFTAPVEPPKPAEPAAPVVAPLPSLFGAPVTTSATPAFSFGAPLAKDISTPEPVVEAPKPAPAVTGFSFSQPAPTPAATLEAPKPVFGSTPTFTFGQPAVKPAEAPKQEEKPASPFSFGAPPATPPAADANKGAFSFGATPASPFSFGTPSATPAAAESKPALTFDAPSTPARPGTPPRVTDSEMNMDESPSRELQAPITAPFGTKPTVSTGFSFGTSTSNGGALFGTSSTPTSATSPFAFGAASSNPFGANKADTKSDDKPASNPFNFGQTTQDATKPASTGFTFGQKAEEKPASAGFSFGQQPQSSTTTGPFSFGNSASEPPRPSTTGSFSFGTPQASTSPFPQPLQLSTSTGSQFSFGQSGSAPSSPAPFHQTPSFTFGAPSSATSTSNPFAFSSSQPASPATSNSGLPASGGSAFSFGSANPTPSTPTSSGGGNLFTIGSSSNPPPPANGARVTRRLPTRRGGKPR